MKDEIAEALNALSNGFEKEAESKYLTNVKKTIAENPHLDIKNPERFSTLVYMEYGRQINLLTKIATADYKVGKEKLAKMRFVYEEYRFISNHLKSLILKYEGRMCSTDKSRWLINSYIDYLVSDKTPEIKKREFWHPRMREVSKWFRWIDSMKPLYYARENEYSELRESIMEDYEKLLETKLLIYKETFTTNQHFVKVTIENNQLVYQFEDSETKDKGFIGIDKLGIIGCRFLFTGDEQKRANYKDTKPKWFEDLIALDQ